MLKMLLKPFVTSAASGVSTRYITVIITTALTVIGLLGWLDDAQVAELKDAMPALVTAISGLIAASVTVYAALKQSSSDKAHEAAKQIDAKLPKSADVEIKTPGPAPNIIVTAEDKSGR